MNNVSVVANLTKDVILRYTPNNKAVATIGVAINTGYGEKKETCFINVVAWGKTAENANLYLLKGSKIAVTGRLQQREWVNKEEKTVKVIEIVAERIDFLDPKNDTQKVVIPEEEVSSDDVKEMEKSFDEEIEEEIIIPEGEMIGEE